jgi:cytochrome P450
MLSMEVRIIYIWKYKRHSQHAWFFSLSLSVSVLRMSKKAHTFSDGTTIPAGVLLAAPTLAHHMDEAIYGEAAQTLDPFRFSDKRALNDATVSHSPSTSSSFREQFTATDLTYLPFGHGQCASWLCLHSFTHFFVLWN